MDLVDLDLCVVLPVTALDAWVRAEPAQRTAWLSGDGPVRQVTVKEQAAFVFRRERPRPSRPLVVSEPRRKVSVVVSGAGDEVVRAAVEAPERRQVLAAALTVPSSLLVMGGDLAHADVAGGTPVAGPHRMLDLRPGSYRVELREVGTPGDAAFAMVIAYEPAEPAAS
jgi:hypothetical protein